MIAFPDDRQTSNTVSNADILSPCRSHFPIIRLTFSLSKVLFTLDNNHSIWQKNDPMQTEVRQWCSALKAHVDLAMKGGSPAEYFWVHFFFFLMTETVRRSPWNPVRCCNYFCFTMYIIFLEKQVDYNGRCHKVPANKRSLRIKYKLRDSHPIIMALVLLNKSRGSRGSGLEPLFKEPPFCPSQVQRCGLSDMLLSFFSPFLGGGEGGAEAKQ